jgi:hypothetical protein
VDGVDLHVAREPVHLRLVRVHLRRQIWHLLRRTLKRCFACNASASMPCLYARLAARKGDSA